MTATAPLDHTTRSKGIGGSDVAALMGLSRYKTKMDIWLSKTGQVPPSSGDTPAQEWGHRLEAVILDKLAERYSLTYLPHPGSLVCDDVWRHAVATVDALGHDFIAEAKSRSAFTEDDWGPDGSRQIPSDVYCQVQWYMGCLHKAKAYVGVLIGGSDFRAYVIPFDRDFFCQCLNMAKDFWRDYIVASVPPPLDGSEGGNTWLKVSYPAVQDDQLADADEYQAGLIRSLVEAKQAVEQAEQVYARLSQLAKQEIGGRKGLTSSYGSITWTDLRGRTKVDWEAVATAAGATPDLVAQHTTTGQPGRTFRLKAPRAS